MRLSPGVFRNIPSEALPLVKKAAEELHALRNALQAAEISQSCRNSAWDAGASRILADVVGETAMKNSKANVIASEERALSPAWPRVILRAMNIDDDNVDFEDAVANIINDCIKY